MSGLGSHLRQRIRAEGPLSVAAFMAEALGHPTFGYYRKADPLGAQGDFITAPEISQMFGELIGLWCVVAWERMGRPASFVLAELGPGRGTLMADALRAAAGMPAFIKAKNLHLVETSPVLRTRQAEALAGYSPIWHADFASLPPGPILLLANEFFDALPIRQFQATEAGWQERLIDCDGESGFRFVLAESTAAIASPAPPGTVLETCPSGLALAMALGARLATQGGAALVIDYGNARSGPGDSFQAVQGHRYCDVLANPGAADLTAHVDFQALAIAASAAGIKSFGPIGQGVFLQRLGIETRLAKLTRNASAQQASLLRSGCRRLIDPSEMGTLFKVLALAHPGLPAMAGFEQDEEPVP